MIETGPMVVVDDGYGRPTAGASPTLDPALVAFVKCHVTSFAAWNVLRACAERVDCWIGPAKLARELNRPSAEVRASLDDLCRHGILEAAGSADDAVFRLPEGQPSSVVIGRLVDQVTRSEPLRQIVVARIARAAQVPSNDVGD